MRWQLSGSGNLLPSTNHVDLRTEVRQFFARDWAAPQDLDLTAADRDDGRFNSVSRRASIDNQRNATVKFIENMLRGRGTDATEAICARRGERFAKLANDLGKDRMRADSNRNRVQTRGHNFRDDFATRQDNRKRSGPKAISQLEDQFSSFAAKIDNFLEPIAPRQMYDERIKAWSLLRFEDFRNGDRIKRIGREPVNGFRRQRNDLAVAQQFNRRVAVG